jgi:outer membrane protein assembly factor BamE (lipoprotein component of BamABCDE complex)
MNSKIAVVVSLLLLLTSCIIQSPKYATLPQVMSLQLGMCKEEVEAKLGIPPYDLKAFTDTTSVYIYVYRVNDRKTLSFKTKPTNGNKRLGKYVQLMIAYTKDDRAISIESCSLCPDNLVVKDKIDFEKIFVFLTVTLPVILLYVGLTKQ